MTKARPALARVTGCVGCGVARAGMLVLWRTKEMICRPCANRLAACLHTADDAALGELLLDEVRRRDGHDPKAEDRSTETTEFREGLERTQPNALAHALAMIRTL